MASRSEMRLMQPGIVAVISCIRFREVLVLQGAPFMGVAFTWQEVSLDSISSLPLFALASLFLVAHIFSFNDWTGIAEDLNDPNKAKDVFLKKGLARREVGLLSVCLLLVSLVLFSLLPFPMLLLAAGIAVLGVLYSHPHLYGKGVPIVSSGLHLIGGMLHFLLGYSLFGGIDRRGVLIGLFFALTFTAGHLNQETRDYEGDRLNGIPTNAVKFGKTRIFLAGFLLFTFAYAYLFWLSYSGFVPPQLRYLLVTYPPHALLFWRTLRGPLTFQTVSRFQTAYRTLYCLNGLAMVISLLVQ